MGFLIFPPVEQRGTGAMGDVFTLMAFNFSSHIGGSEVMVLEMGGMRFTSARLA